MKWLLRMGVAIALYCVLLLVLSFVLRSHVEEKVRLQIGEVLQAQNVSVRDVDLSLLRGRVSIKGVVASRKGLGTADLQIVSIEADIAPLGLVAFSKRISSLTIEGASLDLSAIGAATLGHSKSKSVLQIDRVIVRNARLRLMASGLLPSVGQLDVRVESADAYDVSLENAVSWLFKTRDLRGKIGASGGIEVGVELDDNQLSLSGSVFGKEVLSVPFSWPSPQKGVRELRQLLSLAKSILVQIAPELAKRKAGKLWDTVQGVF